MGKKLYQQFVNARNIFLEISFYHNLKYFKEKFSIFNKKKNMCKKAVCYCVDRRHYSFYEVTRKRDVC